MKVSEIGEFGLIDVLARMAYAGEDKQQESWRQLLLGIGDDAAAWYGDTSIQLATVDALVQDVHFSLGMTTWEELGWRAMAANLSDISAMGGLPRYALISLALPGDTEVEDITNLYRGMMKLAQPFGVAIIGGNISGAPLVVINITILGSTRRQDKRLLTRSAARAGDSIAVTGYVGTAAAGLKMLSQHLQFDVEAANALKQAFLQPCPRVAEGQILLEQGVKAGIDISDGLVADLGHICHASRVSARIQIDLIPVHPAVRANFSGQALELALAGGEDYELLFTAPEEIINRVRAIASCPVTTIGQITTGEAGKVTVVDRQGNPVSLSRGGWEHFTR